MSSSPQLGHPPRQPSGFTFICLGKTPTLTQQIIFILKADKEGDGVSKAMSTQGCDPQPALPVSQGQAAAGPLGLAGDSSDPGPDPGGDTALTATKPQQVPGPLHRALCTHTGLWEKPKK